MSFFTFSVAASLVVASPVAAFVPGGAGQVSQTGPTAVVPRTSNDAEALGKVSSGVASSCLPGERPTQAPITDGRTRLRFAAGDAPEISEIIGDEWKRSPALPLRVVDESTRWFFPSWASDVDCSSDRRTMTPARRTPALVAAREERGVCGAQQDTAAVDFESVLASSRRRRRVLHRTKARAARVENRHRFRQRHADSVMDVVGVVAPLFMIVGMSVVQSMA